MAEKLGLSKETRASIASLIEKRLNDPKSLELALSAKNLPAEERAAKLKSFREESEKMGLKLLTEEQQKKLQQVRLEKAGLSGAGRSGSRQAAWLERRSESQVAELVSSREKQLNVASANSEKTP